MDQFRKLLRTESFVASNINSLVAKNIKIDQDVNKSLVPVKESFNELITACSQLEKLVLEVINRADSVLNRNLKKELQKAFESFQQMTDELNQIRFGVDHNPQVYYLLQQITNFQTQGNSLYKTYLNRKQHMHYFVQTCKNIKVFIDDQRKQLKSIQTSNLQISFKLQQAYEKEHKRKEQETLKKFRPKNTISMKDALLKSQKIMKNQRNFQIMKSNINNVQSQIHTIIQAQGAYINEQRYLEQFYQSCLNSSKIALIQTQIKPQKKNRGLAGSLLFEMISNLNDEQNETKIKSQNNQIGIDSKQMIYHTAQLMLRNSRMELKRNQIKNLKVTYQDFDQFTPLQILGLLYMNKEVLIQLHQKIFPANLLHKVIPTKNKIQRSKSQRLQRKHRRRVQQQHNQNEKAHKQTSRKNLKQYKRKQQLNRFCARS